MSEKVHRENGSNSFIKLNAADQLIPILKERLPRSCFVYNQAIKYRSLKNDLTFYTIGSDINKNTWIVSCNTRQDLGVWISISAPVSIITGEDEILPEIKECFITGADFLDWDEDMVFGSMEKLVSAMLIDISVNVKGNVTKVHPGHLYIMEQNDAENLEISHDPNVEVRRLSVEKGEETFFVSTWIYAAPGFEDVVKNSLQHSVSGGVFLDGKCVSGVYIPPISQLSALFTLNEHRNKGFGKLAMNFACKEFAKEGCIPCVKVEVKNEMANRFTQSMGFKIVSDIDGILVMKLGSR